MAELEIHRINEKGVAWDTDVQLLRMANTSYGWNELDTLSRMRL